MGIMDQKVYHVVLKDPDLTVHLMDEWTQLHLEIGFSLIFSYYLSHAKHLTRCKVLIGDNLASHFNSDVIKECEISNINFDCLPKIPHIWSSC